MNFKGRTNRQLFQVVLGCFFIFSSNKAHSQISQNIQVVADSTNGYWEVKPMWDSISNWLFTKEDYNYQGLLLESEFVAMSRLSDSVSPDIVVHGQYMQYRWRVYKGMERAKKKSKKYKLKEGKIQANWSKRISYDNEGLYRIKRVEVPVSYRKNNYNIRFEALFWKGKWYHVGAVTVMLD